MRIHILDLRPELTLRIDGTESWLGRIYADVESRDMPAVDKPLLTGNLKLVLEEAGSVYVSGKLDYAPVVPCSRCAIGVAWPLALNVGVRFLPASVNDPAREKNLTAAELDVYYLDGDYVDLESVVNDVVQTGLPTRVIVATDDGSSCRICHDDLTEVQVYGKPDELASSGPFAALNKLKLPN